MAEPYSSVQVRMGALQKPRYVFSGVLPPGTVYVGRGRETHRHDYTRMMVKPCHEAVVFA